MNVKPPERTFPPRCAICHGLLADTGKPHCDWRTNHQCPWMTCKCGAIIRADGRAMALRDGKWISTEAAS